MRNSAKTTNNPYLKMALEGAKSYHRQRHLPALLALWPTELDDFSLKGTKEIIRQLKSALQAERRRGRANHWCYDLNRHIALLSALTGEEKSLTALSKKRLSRTKRTG